MRIAALIPAYNEELTIGTIVLLCKEYVDEVIVVDDGSTDRTARIAEAAGARVIRHRENKGKGAALKTGFKATDADIIVTLDGDGQHDPQEIPKLVQPIIDGRADIVNGSRYLSGSDKSTPFYRRVGQKILDRATNISTRLDITDTQSGFRAFSRDTIPYFKFKEDGFAIESEMLLDAAESNLRIVEVEIGVTYDVEGSTKHPISHGASVLYRIIKDMELRRPLYYFTFPGLIIVVIGAILTLIFLRDYIIGKSIHMGPTILAIMLTLFGTFFMFTGIILDSMKKMIRNFQKR
ncbi:glycosyltransferase family 2 protein [Methanothermobacter tenebrarum]|uniref:Glycosyltransferase family 2 protein n=1 Tax=Methanothermobacter tenebrarum TaxID=680118 RepID=A0A328P996_9EURY|nr:glycosyltransferase family 2 protein [Methanothermobacter tenebrarum]MBC7101486.1 glycosyltransferase family 2 protein [Methanobacteriales archaeon]MBC7118289.1 glycosyltransferase family 2 protein [Methanobacteriaceae archaeon]NPV64613.1 glycosyltransferase [Methanobacteriaceae archaeon]RAO78659.1 glycosyltransferase family 2 protein [Methanothermobacter tenebrarum]